MKTETNAGYRQIVFRVDEKFYKKIEKTRREKYPFMKMNAFVAFCVNLQCEREKQEKTVE